MSVVKGYKEIQLWMFDYYPIYCRLKIRSSKKRGFSWVEGETEVGYALNEMEDSFSHPVEEMMLQIAGLVLSAGRSPAIAFDMACIKIKEIIARYGLESLLAQLSEEDSRVVRSDLELLDII